MAAPTFDASHSQLATRRDFDRNFGEDAVNLRPGEYSITDEDVVLVMLGSCVAACLRGPYTGFGGMKHFVLPKAGGDVELLSRWACP